MADTLHDKVAVAAVKAAKNISDKAEPTAAELALGRSLFVGSYDQRLGLVCASLFGDTDATSQATIDTHVTTAVVVMGKLGLS